MAVSFNQFGKDISFSDGIYFVFDEVSHVRRESENLFFIMWTSFLREVSSTLVYPALGGIFPNRVD